MASVTQTITVDAKDAIEALEKLEKTKAGHEATVVAETWALAFAATFAVAAKPALDAANLGTAKAVIVSAAVAGVAAGGRAARPVLIGALAKLGGAAVWAKAKAATAPAAPAETPAAPAA